MTDDSYYQKNKDYFTNRYEKQRERLREYAREHTKKRYYIIRKNNPSAYLLKKAKDRANKNNIPFNITIDDIVIPEYCPVLGIPLAMSNGQPSDNSPTVDRINNNLGYIKGNVSVISFKANRLKSNLSIVELKRFANWINDNLT